MNAGFQLTRLRVAELRRFREPFELRELQPGLNLFSGPNEAGKSTLVRALRAAFFERHRSTSVDDLRPYGDSAAAPSIELDFAFGGTAYRLSKSFLGKKRCELFIGPQRLEGVAAEDALAELLGFQFAAKGASREEHWGIPGLLWIEQGAAQAVQGAVLHAADHLRKALEAHLGEVAASGGDDVVAQVRAWRDELLTSTGRPKAVLQKAHDDAAALAAQVEALQTAVHSYRSQVDQLRELRAAHAADEAAAPWAALRQQQAAAQQALQAAEAQASERTRVQERLRQAEGLRSLLAQRLADAERQQQGLQARQAAMQAAQLRFEQAAEREAQAQRVEATAMAALQAARATLAAARQADTRRVLTRQLADAGARATELAALLQRASAAHEQAQRLQQQAAALQLPARELATLRQQQGRLQELQIRQAAVATRLQLELVPGAQMQLQGAAGGTAETLSGDTERLLLTPTVLTLPGLGRLHIAPGGPDLPALAQQQAALQDEHTALLQRLGLASLAEAETRAQQHAQRVAEASAAAQLRDSLVPQGLDALRSDLHAAQAREAEARTALAQLPPAPENDTAPGLALAEAERRHEAARGAAEEATRALQAARHAQASAAGQRDAAVHEHSALQATLADPAWQAQQAQWQRDLVEATALHATQQRELAEVEQRIAAARPDILRQDVQRYGRSADEAEQQHRARERQIVQLETALAGAGADGLEEELERQRSAHALAARRAEELQRRADALSLLLHELDSRRQALTQRLQAPLQQHLNHYLPLLFAGSALAVDERLVPGALSRPGPRGPEAADFETLSFGAREQMGVLARLAYADLLREAGRPTLVILDDALVHSDTERLAQMKRVLFDAAQRHQVLLFTCHPALWRDMGVAVRALPTG
ncbi:AAA family ATPase [Rubrivivax rivuli]|uniref:GTP-binding protein n=1 Tax=Rubrivivax rivuli TaxID=1862385 RepID=A0A437RAU7_9BURK|nr:ATP-binding protein [Rubrivivax rivuli]RVU43918.1 GTP-binding protein [Rubrivivax rivuli]